MRTNTSWAFAGNAVYAGCQWAVFILLVKSLGLADVGVFAYGVAITGPIFVLANVRLRNLLATGTESPRDFIDYLTARLLTTTAAVGLSLVVGALVASGPTALAVVAAIAFAKACDAISDICHGLFQRGLDMRSAAIGLIVNGVMSVALVALSLQLVTSLIVATAAYAIGSCAALLFWDLPRTAAAARIRTSTSPARGTVAAAARLIGTALPLGCSAAVGSVQANLPRYVVASALGPAALAIFAALSYVPTIGNLIVNAIAQAALPLLARDLRTSRERYRARLSRLVVAGVGLGVASVLGAALVGRPLLTWIYRIEYTDQMDVLLWLMTAAAVTYAYVFLGTGATARLRFGAQLGISLTGLSVVAGSIGPLIGRFGLRGAAWSLVAGAAVEGCAYAALTIRDLRAMEATDTLSGMVSGAVGP